MKEEGRRRYAYEPSDGGEFRWNKRKSHQQAERADKSLPWVLHYYDSYDTR